MSRKRHRVSFLAHANPISKSMKKWAIGGAVAAVGVVAAVAIYEMTKTKTAGGGSSSNDSALSFKAGQRYSIVFTFAPTATTTTINTPLDASAAQNFSVVSPPSIDLVKKQITLVVDCNQSIDLSSNLKAFLDAGGKVEVTPIAGYISHAVHLPINGGINGGILSHPT